MSAHLASPFTMQRLGMLIPELRLPSISASEGLTDSFSIARFMASSAAFRILISSISSTLANAMPKLTASEQIKSKSLSLFCSLSFFESLRPSISRPRGSMTAAAHTGPASGPRPASSTPHRISTPLSYISFSSVQSSVIPASPGLFCQACHHDTRPAAYLPCAQYHIRLLIPKIRVFLRLLREAQIRSSRDQARIYTLR